MDELFAHFRRYWPDDGSTSSSAGAGPAAPAQGDMEEDQESESLDEDSAPLESDGYDVELAAALGVPQAVVENLSPKKPSPEKSEKQDPPLSTLTESEQRKRRIQELQPSDKNIMSVLSFPNFSLF